MPMYCLASNSMKSAGIPKKKLSNIFGRLRVKLKKIVDLTSSKSKFQVPFQVLSPPKSNLNSCRVGPLLSLKSYGPWPPHPHEVIHHIKGEPYERNFSPREKIKSSPFGNHYQSSPVDKRTSCKQCPYYPHSQLGSL